MNILVVGRRMRKYPRNRVFLDILGKIHQTKERDVLAGSFWECVGILWEERSSHDAILLMQPVKEFVIPTLLMNPFLKGKIIGDAFTSLYDTFVGDRALAGKWSLKAIYYFSVDWLFVRMCDVLLFDTEEHKKYFERTFGLGERRSIIVPVAVNTDMVDAIKPKKLPHAEEGKFQVFFCGTYIPLQGVEYIIHAAYILRDYPTVRFTLLGNGQTRDQMKLLADQFKLTNLTFMDRAPYDILLAYTKGADLALGVFGGTEKAARVIPNKLLEAMACGTPVVTGKNSAMGRYFKDGKEIYYCDMGDAQSLANAILRAYGDRGNYDAIRTAARTIIEQEFSTLALKQHLREIEESKKTANANTKERIVLYTAIFGKKDNLITPKYIPANCDFVCFTDQPLRSRVWQVRRVDSTEADPTRSARKYKILAHQFLPEYRTSIWVDGNVLVGGDVNELVRDYLADANMAVIDHAKSKEIPLCSLKEHEERLLSMERVGKHQEDPELIKRQGDAYRTLGYPDNTGMAWTCVLLRRHNEPGIVLAMEAWWEELVRWSKRDQMSFNFIAWKTGLHFNYIPLDGADNSYFKRVNHRLPWYRKLNSYRIGGQRRLKKLLGIS